MTARTSLPTVEPQPYGDPTELNTARLILDSVGKDVLADIMADYLGLLQTSAAIYEANGDYAQGIFTSGWCRKMDGTSRRLCGTDDNREALGCGKWHCHESCWTISKASIDTGQPADEPCLGGIRIYAVPVWAGAKIVGSLNFGYGDPPTDPEKLRELSQRYGLSVQELRTIAESYQHRDPWITEVAKHQLATAARLLGVMIERTQSEQEERRLSGEMRLLNDVIEQSTQPLAMANFQGQILRANRAFERLTGYSRDELQHMTYQQLTPACWHEVEAKQVAQVLATGEAVRYQKEYRRKDGFIVPIELVAGVYRTDAGQPQFFYAFVTDISERKGGEEVLRQSEEFNRSLIESSQDCIKTLDLQGNLLSMSLGGQRLLEITDLGPLLHQCWINFWKEEDRPCVAEAVAAAAAGRTGRFQAYCPSAKGQPHWWDVIITPIYGASGLVERLLAVSRDITERKRAEIELRQKAEELARSNLDLEQFAYDASHDLQEPLRAVGGCVQVLQKRYEGRLDERADELIAHTVAGVSRMQTLINDLLAYSRVTTRGKAFEASDCQAILKVALANLDAAVREAGAILNHEPLPVVLADPTQLTQLFQNLLSNAIKFRSAAPPIIHVGATRQDGRWVVSVKDNGVLPQPE